MTTPVYIAAAGNEWLTELAVRTARRRSSLPVDVTVGGSVGNESVTLGHLGARIQVSPGLRHGHWLDRWTAEAAAPYAVFLDSDVFFTHSCWLTPLIAALDAGAGLVSCDIFSRTEGVIEPVAGDLTTAMPRPAPWVMGINVGAVRETGESFEFNHRTLPSGERLAWDVGGKVIETLAGNGWPVVSLPPGYARCFTHVGAMSWRPLRPARIETRRWAKVQRARLHYRYERLRA